MAHRCLKSQPSITTKMSYASKKYHILKTYHPNISDEKLHFKMNS